MDDPFCGEVARGRRDRVPGLTPADPNALREDGGAARDVDRSIDAPGDFVRTNVVGTYTMLAVAPVAFAASATVLKIGIL